MLQRDKVWMAVVLPLAIGAGAAANVGNPRVPPRLLHLAYGLVAAGLLVLGALLGVRKKVLRLRVGSMSAWLSAHNWLGGLALFFALVHARGQLGGTLTGSLLVLLAATVATGLV